MKTPSGLTGNDLSAGAGGVQISFLMPMYNGLALTRESLRTLEATIDLSSHEVILINDASTDGTAKFLDKLQPPYRVIHNSERAGYAVGMNRGVGIARGEMLCLLNNDLVFTANWLPPMLRAFDQLEHVGFVGNVQVNPRSGKYDHLGVVFAPNGKPWHFGKHFFFRPFRGYAEWKAVTAACCLIKRSVFLAAGGFDEAYKNGCEDVDLCLRLRAKGFRHYVANDSIIEHHVSSSEGRHDFNVQNEGRLMERWHEQVLQEMTPRDRRLFASNYLLRFLTQPWRYNGFKLARAILTLAKLGH